MTKITHIIATFAFLALIASCKKEQGCTDPTATNYNVEAEENDGSCVYPNTEAAYTIPEDYNFEREGNSTVSFNGQAQRLEMLSEITTYLKTANTAGTALDENTLLTMYANEGFTWNDGPALGMTGSSKQLQNKTAAAPSGTADQAIINIYQAWMSNAAALSATTVAGQNDGAAGTGGVVQSTTDESKQYLQTAEGIEYTQYIEKGLMGAVFYNQIQQWYLGTPLTEADNETAVDEAAGKYYTQMEHFWDEAYGYFTTATDYPTSGTDRFWGKYANSREGVLGSASKINAAFRKGRAAISNDDLNTRNAQIAIIREELELVAAGTAIHYLNSAMSNFGDDALRNHALSEFHAFLSAVPYGYEPAMTLGEVNAVLDLVGDNYYEVTLSDLENARASVAQATGLNNVATEL